MSEGYEEDLEMYEESTGGRARHLDNKALMQPIEELDYPSEAEHVSPDDTVGTAIRKMVDKRIGSLPVTDDGKVVGIFGERDLLMKGLYEGDKLDRPVKEFMTPDPVCLTVHDPIAFALNRMVVGGYRHIPLVNNTGALEGILTMRDVMRYVVSFFPVEVVSLPPHSEHNPPERNIEGS